jgi:hypothetical protein
MAAAARTAAATRNTPGSVGVTPNTRVAGRLFDRSHVPEFHERAPFGLAAIHPGSDVILDQPLPMESNLVPNARVTTLAEPHVHSVHSAVRRMPEIAADRRSQFARCSSSCFRPSLVSE